MGMLTHIPLSHWGADPDRAVYLVCPRTRRHVLGEYAVEDVDVAIMLHHPVQHGACPSAPRGRSSSVRSLRLLNLPCCVEYTTVTN